MPNDNDIVALELEIQEIDCEIARLQGRRIAVVMELETKKQEIKNAKDGNSKKSCNT
jgi:hypothetical protein